VIPVSCRSLPAGKAGIMHLLVLLAVVSQLPGTGDLILFFPSVLSHLVISRMAGTEKVKKE